jgi:hypothetical protein
MIDKEFTMASQLGAETLASAVKPVSVDTNPRRLTLVRRPDGKVDSDPIPLSRINGRWVHRAPPSNRL